MQASRYQDLRAWQRAVDLVESVYRVTAALPDEEMFGLKSQMRRCAVSIPSNIAEGRVAQRAVSFSSSWDMGAVHYTNWKHKS